MADQLGVSFSPLDTGQGGQSGPGPGGSPLQDAIKILSFRMPTVVGAQGVSPLAGNPGDNPTDNWLQNLFKGLLPPDQPGVPGQPAAPVGPMVTGAPGPMGGAPPSAPNVFGGAPPPGPPPGGAPNPIVITTPPGIPKTTDPGPPPVSTAPVVDKMPMDGPPDYRDDPQGWKDWVTGGRRF